MLFFIENAFLRKNYFPTIILFAFFLVVLSTLLISNVFIYQSLTPYFAFLISISAFTVIAGFTVLIKGVKLNITWPTLAVIVWGIYIVVNGFFTSYGFNPFNSYLIFTCCFWVSLSLVLSIKEFKVVFLYRIIGLLASLEVVICLGQYLKFFHSFNEFFPVTGSWGNPNVTAMFLSMALLAIFHLIFNEILIYKKIAIVIFVLILLTLMLLQCRTAIIGALVGSIIIIGDRYNLRKRFTNKKNRSGSALVLIFCIATIIPSTAYLYNVKKASADGRRLIWKISADMIFKNPLVGSGYGSFEKYYNLSQLQYFKEGNATANEAKYAGFVRMGYNEFLQNTVEGGFIGLCLILSIILSLLLLPISKSYYAFNAAEQHKKGGVHKNSIETNSGSLVAFTGVIVFSLMSLFNFSIQAIPVMCLFVVYGTVLTKNLLPISFNKIKLSLGGVLEYRFSKYNWICGVAFILLGMYSLYFNILRGYAAMSNKQAIIQARDGNYELAVNNMACLGSSLYNYESYWTSYASLFIKKEKYKDAIDFLNKGQLYTSNPEIYIKKAFCYAKTGNYAEAEKNYLAAKYIEPSKLSPKFALMKMYYGQRDTIRAIGMAQEIITQEPKLFSKETNWYKRQATALIEIVVKNHPQYLLKNYPAIKVPVL
jgi:O-antigen ligase